MSRIVIPTIEQAPGAAQPLLAAVKTQLGIVPNLMRVVAHSPAALEGYLALNGALAKGVLDTPLREQIALAVAEYNGCDYCLAAHSYLGRHAAKLDEAAIAAARSARAKDAKADAALRFARRVAESRGKVGDADLATLRAAGFGDAAAVEIVVNVALNVLTNYVNNVAATDVDFPKVERLAA